MIASFVIISVEMRQYSRHCSRGDLSQYALHDLRDQTAACFVQWAIAKQKQLIQPIVVCLLQAYVESAFYAARPVTCIFLQRLASVQM